MAIVFDPSTKRIILDSFGVTATEIYSRWVDWAATDDNLKYGMVIRQVGGDDLGGGLSIPPYYFLQGTWRVRPQEASGLTTLTGNLFVEGGGIPVVNTIGSYNSSVQYTVPVQAQAFDSSGGGGGGLTSEQAVQLAEIWKLAGLDAANPMTVTPATRVTGTIELELTGDPETSVTVTRQ